MSSFSFVESYPWELSYAIFLDPMAHGLFSRMIMTHRSMLAICCEAGLFV